MHLHQLADTLGVVTPGPPCRDLDVTPAPQRLTHHELVANALALVLVVHPGLPAPFGLPWRLHLTEELLAGLVEADQRVPPVVRQEVRLEHVFHSPAVLPVGVVRHTPGLREPRVDVVFFRAWRTVSVLTDWTEPSATSSSASSCKDQWQRPSGGSLHASRTSCCSTSPLILILSGRGGWGLWSRAARKPWVTKRWRTRARVREPTPKAVMRSSSVRGVPGDVSASSRMRAWVSFRAAAFPVDTSRSKPIRSSAVSVTRYLSIAKLRELGPAVAL